MIRRLILLVSLGAALFGSAYMAKIATRGLPIDSLDWGTTVLGVTTD